MGISLPSAAAGCSLCGEPLNARGDCLACLLRTGLNEPLVDSAPSIASVFGDFEIARRQDGSLCELGRGGMGVTYLATDKVLRRKVALKVIKGPVVPTRRESQAARERFLREARAAAALRHPNIAAVFQFGAAPDGSRCFYAMELVEGETLDARIRRDGPLNATVVLHIAIQVTQALAAAAGHGLIHRDLKPGNIMLTSPAETEMAGVDGTFDTPIKRRGDNIAHVPVAPLDRGAGRKHEKILVKIIDFGLAKAIAQAENEMDLTHGEFVGTPNFASPEQFANSPLDVRSDIYSLGATLWFALTGKTPFTGGSIEELRNAQRSNVLPVEQLKTARVPSGLASLIQSMLAIEPACRPGVHDLLARLRRYCAHASRVRGTRVVIAGAAAIVILAASAFLIFPSLRTHATGTAAPSEVSEKSIAVLPFENASNDPNAEYLSEGISEALINSLTELQRLRVVARSTAFQYKGKDVDPRRLGRELHVASVLTGRVRQSQDALSIQVDLVDAVTGAQLWGEEYVRKISDVIAVKQAIAREVTAKLKLKLTGEEQRRLAKGDSTNTEAYRFYLRGRYFWNKRTPDGIKQAILEFQQAIERDPHFALGYVGLADCYTGLTFYNFAAPHETMPRAKESAIKALALDNTLAEAHASLAHVLMNYDWNWSEAEKEFRRSIELKPDYATAHQWYAIHYLTATGRLEEAVQEMKKALELDPASLVMNTFMGATLYYAGRYDEAIDQCRRTIEMDPNFGVAHWHLGLAYEQKHSFEEASEEFKKAISLSRGSPLMRAALGRAYAESQKKDEANEILDELNDLATRQYISAYEVAKIYVALGNNEQAFRLLRKATAEHSFHLVNLNVCPQLNPIRSDRRFQDLVQRVGLSR